MWRRAAGKVFGSFRLAEIKQIGNHTYKRSGYFLPLGSASYCASHFWRKSTVPAFAFSSSSDWGNNSFLLPSILAALGAASLYPWSVGADEKESSDGSRKKLLKLLEGFAHDTDRQEYLGPGGSLWMPSANLRLVTVLNEGNFGKIWVGELQDSSGTQEVAVKLLSEDLLRDRDLSELLRCEAEVFHRVSTRCHHVCRLYGITWKGDHLCLVMKLYKKSLFDHLQEHGGRVSVDEIKKYGQQVCKGLVELHEQGVIMQDLKSSNVLIDDLDHAVLADFGMASFVDRNQGSVVITAAKGTPSYMAPEAWDPQAMGGMSTKSDIWSLGCLIIELFAGRPPWHGEEVEDIAMQVKDEMKRPTIPRNVPAPLAQALRRCFAYHGEHRPGAREMLNVFLQEWEVVEEDLTEVQEPEEAPPPVAVPPPPIEQASFYSFSPTPSTEQLPRLAQLYEVDKDLYRAVQRLSHLVEGV